MALIIRTLGEMLKSRDELEWGLSFFMKGNYPFHENTPVILIPETVHLPEGDEGHISEQTALAEGFIDVFDASEVQDIVDNAIEQLPDATPEQLLQAFNYYYENDAFIEF